jgi:copper chaperone
LKTIVLNISGMQCGHCVMAVEQELKKLAIESVKVTMGHAEICFDENRVSESALRSAIEDAGYQVL